MKHFLLLFFYCTYFGMQAQTNTFTGAIDSNWNNGNNWSLNALPGATNDVVIPTGKTANLTVAATIKSIQLAGTAVLNIQANLSIAQSSTVSAQSIINWGSGNLSGGGTLNNLGTMVIVPGSKQILGGTILNNSGTISENTDWALDISNGTLNNMASGIIDLQNSQSNIIASGSGSHVLNNAGLIKKTGTGTATISAELHNTAVLSVESGTMQLNNAQTVLTGGTYNTAVGTNLLWLATETVSGTLGGTINGELHWAGTVNVPVAATFNFAGSGTVNWGNGHLTGGGTLTNAGLLWMTSAYYGSKYIENNTTFNNNGTITISTDWQLDITNGTLNNLASGIIDLKNSQSNIIGSGSGSHVLNNAGLIKKTGTGTATISAELHNTAILSVESGTMQLNNPQIMLSGGTYNTATGTNLLWISTETLSGTLGGTINGELNWAGTVNVPVAATLTFAGNGTVNWGNGHLTGGGTLTNSGLLWMTGAYYGPKYIENNTTFNNNGTINIATDWQLDITNGTLNNLASGVIDIQMSPVDIMGSGTGSHVLNNAGLIRKTGGIGYGTIRAELHNTGTLSVEMGYLDVRNPSSAYIGGTYNVSSGCYLFNYEPVTCSGTLTGTVEGGINWVSDIKVPVAAAFNFSGNGTNNWAAGAIRGGGTLTNLGMMELSSGWVGAKSITESTTLVNSNIIKITSDQTMTMNGGTITNLASAVLDIRSPGTIGAGSGTNNINNQGLLLKSASIGTYTINPLINNTGVIQADAGTITFGSLNNTVSGTIKGTAAIHTPTAVNFTNNGIFAPGGEPGSLSVIGDYQSTAATRLQVQLYGLTAGTQYDTMTIQGNASMAGTIVPELHFDPAIGSSFIVANTTGTITSCALVTTATTIYSGQEYTFSVGCQNDNKVVLTLTQKTLANEEFNSLEKQIALAPNPAENYILIRNNSSILLSGVTISDASGRIIASLPLGEGDLEVPLLGYAAGVYFMRFDTAVGKVSKRFIVR